MSYTSQRHKCPDCGTVHTHTERVSCDAPGCNVVASTLPYTIVTRAPWGGEDGTDILHACSPEHVAEVASRVGADYEVEITGKAADMRKLWAPQPTTEKPHGQA